MSPRARDFALTFALLCNLGFAHAQQIHSARGMITAIDAPHRKLVISCNEVRGYMAPMEMEFVADSPTDLTPLKQGSVVTFTMVEAQGIFRAKDIRVAPTANLESEPLQAGQLSMLHKTLTPDRTVAVGEPVPDFQLIDQAGNTVRLSRLRGKAVALTFGYSRCPNPNYCLRLSNNLGKVQQRFRQRAGRDFVLLTVNIDPEHDSGDTLARYAASFHADPTVWHFLTGPPLEIHRVANLFGMDFWNEEGLVTHTLHTAIIDGSGILVANLDGNAFTAEQLGDLLETVMNRDQQRQTVPGSSPIPQP